jgi:hypothetical protein
MAHRHTSCFAAVVLLLGLASTASPQDASDDWVRATSQTRPGDVVQVTDTGSRAFRWRLGEIPIDEVIRQAGLDRTSVATMAVERTDSLWNGVLIGVAAAGVPWLVVCAANDWCYYNEYGAENLLRVTALTTTAIGAGVGALIDLSIRQRFTVFRNTLRASPQISRNQVAVRLSLAF